MNNYLSMLILAVVFIGCTQTRSISNSGYQGTWGYQGELIELEVLGFNDKQQITEGDIKKALKSETKVSLTSGDRVVLVQSGAQFPDGPMLKGMESYFSVIPLSGVPAEDNRARLYLDRGHEPFRYRRDKNPTPKQPIDKTLRLASAQAGAKTMIVYWGVLESGQSVRGTKLISWTPIVGQIIPDVKQNMRIRLKVAVIDVATGAWEFVIPEVYNETRHSAAINREESDQGQVARLKAKAYEALVKDLLKRFN